MNIFMIAGISLIACAMAILLKQHKPEFALLVSLCAGVLIFLYAINHLNPAITVLKNLMNKATINQDYVKAILKTLSVCYVTQLASDSCIDAGQTAIASKVNMCGKIFILLISLPLFENLVEIAMKLINN